MEYPTVVHPRVNERHPELTEQDVLCAWENTIRSAPRLENAHEYVSIGFDDKGRLIEMVAIRNTSGRWLIYHVKTPPTKKTMTESGVKRRRL